MTKEALKALILQKKSFLCVGLDSDPQRLPAHLPHTVESVLAFNKAIVEATKDFCVAYKVNTAFYEAMGQPGWEALHETFRLIPDTHFTIADAKRGDIGNTSTQYARAFFQEMSADGLTVAPYMGEDSVRPFLGYPQKWLILLALTSNTGSQDFQRLKLENGKFLFEEVLEKSKQWANAESLMYVVGATQADALQRIRKIIPEHFLLVPGVGAQGGSLREVAENGMNESVGLLVNASRSIIYASSGEDFAEAAGREAQKLQQEMEALLAESAVLA
jgi:orotidine-5'-phosphate decarboxylase